MTDMALVDELTWDESLHPRQHVDNFNVSELARKMEAGVILDPVVACRRTKRLADGVHRWLAAKSRGEETISVEWRDYPEGPSGDEELWRDSIRLNDPHGLKLSTYDRLKIIDVGADRFKLTEADLAQLMATTVTHLRSIAPRYATLQAAAGDAPNLRRKVPLKASTRHLSQQSVTASQAQAIAGAPGTPYLLLVNQLLDAVKNDLLPPVDQHPDLWAKLKELRDLLL